MCLENDLREIEPYVANTNGYGGLVSGRSLGQGLTGRRWAGATGNMKV